MTGMISVDVDQLGRTATQVAGRAEQVAGVRGALDAGVERTAGAFGDAAAAEEYSRLHEVTSAMLASLCELDTRHRRALDVAVRLCQNTEDGAVEAASRLSAVWDGRLA